MGGMSDDQDEKTEDALSKIRDDEELIKTLGRWERESKNHWGQWRKTALEEYKYVAGDQWSTDDKAVLLDEERVPIVFNRIDPMISAVLGAEILNRQEVTYLPREVGDVRTNEIINDAAQWVRDSTDASDEESDAFLDCIVTGLGWTETRMDFEEDPEGMIRIDRVSPLQMWVDPSATKRGLSDRRYHWRGRYMERHEVRAMWPGKYEQIVNAGSDGDETANQTNVNGPGDEYADADDMGPSQETRGRIWVRHFQWFDLVDGIRVIDPDSGNSTVQTKQQWRQTVAEYMAMGVRPPPASKIKTRRYMEAFVAGNVLLMRREIDGFTFHALTGKRDESNGTWYGLVRAMRDPQKWANKWFSQIMHILNTSAKGGLLYEEGAFTNPRKALEEWARPNGGIELSVNGLQRVKERTPANYPQGLDRLMQFAFDAMPQVSGINMEMMGLVGKDQPGVLEAHRKQAGYAILAQFFDALKLYRRRQGRTLLDFIENYISDGRLIRITGENGNEQYVPLVRDGSAKKYDIIVDDAPMSANQKQTVWMMLVQMMPMLKDAPLPGDVWADLIRYSPLPSALSSKIGKAISEAQQQPNPAAEAEAAKTQSEVARNQSQAQLNQAKAEEISGTLPVRVQEAAANAQQTAANAAKTQAEIITGAFMPQQRSA